MSAVLAIVARPTHAWLSADEVCAKLKWSRRTFFRRCAELVSREVRVGVNGRQIREYLAASLPGAQAALELVGHNPIEIGPLFASSPAASAERILLPNPELQAQAQRRYEILLPLIDFQPGRYAHLRLADGRPVTSQERMIELTAQTSGQSIPTIKRWLARYRAGDFSALADRIRADKGQSRWFRDHENAAVLAAHLYLNERQSISFVCDQIRYEAETLGLDPSDLPGRETVRVFLAREVSPAMKTLAREGQRQYSERMAPYLRRGYTDTYANQIWVGDHMIHDVEVANDLFEEAPFGAPVRLRLSAMLDYRSRKLVGASWAWEGSSRAIAATMRRGIQAFGPPEHIYVDNGKDYKKVAKGATRGCEMDASPLEPKGWWRTELDVVARTGFLARLGIAVTHCIPRHPQSKHVERFFRTLHQQFDAVHSTYTSGSPWTRPDATEAAMMRHRRLLKAGRVEESNHPLASRLILGCLSWIELYNDTPHSGEGMEGRTPNEVFEAEANPNQRPTPEPATLALLMCEYERRLVRECAVTIRKRRYQARPEDRMAWAAMHEANEREILVAFDPGDPECAAALDLDGRFLAWLEAEQFLRFAPNDPETQRQIGESMEIRRGLEKATKQSLSLIARAARAQGARSAEEKLYDRLQLPATAEDIITQHKPRARRDSTAAAPKSAAEIASSFLEAMK